MREQLLSGRKNAVSLGVVVEVDAVVDYGMVVDGSKMVVEVDAVVDIGVVAASSKVSVVGPPGMIEQTRGRENNFIESSSSNRCMLAAVTALWSFKSFSSRTERVEAPLASAVAASSAVVAFSVATCRASISWRCTSGLASKSTHFYGRSAVAACKL